MTTSKFRVKAKTQLHQSHLVPNITKQFIHFHMRLTIWVLKQTPSYHNCPRQGFQMPGKKFRASREVENAFLHPPLPWVALRVTRTSGQTQQT